MIKLIKQVSLFFILAASTMATTVLAADKVIVGGKFYTEQFILSEMTAQLLKARHIPVEMKTGTGSTLTRKAFENGEIDVYWEYTGTALTVYHKIKEHLSPKESYDRVKMLDAKKGLIWLKPARLNNTYALAMREEDVAKTGIHTISDLAAAYRKKKSLP